MKTPREKKRTGVLVGAYVSPAVKEALRRRARAQHTTVSAILKEILEKELAK